MRRGEVFLWFVRFAGLLPLIAVLLLALLGLLWVLGKMRFWLHP